VGDPSSELTISFSETVRTLFSAGSVTDTLAQVVELAVATSRAVTTPASFSSMETWSPPRAHPPDCGRDRRAATPDR